MSISLRSLFGESSRISLVSQSIPYAFKSPLKMRVVLGFFLKVSVIPDNLFSSSVNGMTPFYGADKKNLPPIKSGIF